MPIITRAEKGAPLTSQEIDGNFKELETRIDHLTDHQEAGEGIGKIYLEGDQLHIIGTFGTDFGIFTLPKANLNPCGPWASQMPYKKLDLVTSDNALSCCIADHTSTEWTQDHLFWTLILHLPQPPSLSLYERSSLPEKETLGKLALLLEEEGSTLIFFNGKNWQRLTKGENL